MPAVDINNHLRRTSPAYSLVEVLMHELANPVQAARTTLRLWQGEEAVSPGSRSRIQGLDTAFERIAVVIRSIQAVKESSLIPASPVQADRLLADITTECRAFGHEVVLESWPTKAVTLGLHGAAIPLLLASWAAVSNAEQRRVRLSLEQTHEQWTLRANLRPNQSAVVNRDITVVAVAGFPAAIGEFMLSAGGSAELKEDDAGTFEIVLTVREWLRDENS